MKIRVLITGIVFQFACANLLLAQDDFHLSQFDMATMYINPALTGMYEGQNGDYRMYNDDRSQWGAIGKPFSTVYLGYDMPFRKWNKNFGFGAYLVDNSAPAGYFNTFNLMLSGAYNILHNTNHKHYLTTGLQMGFFNKFFDPNSFTFDNQYSPAQGGFDQNLPNGEIFPKTSVLNFDANYGLFYKFIDTSKRFNPFAGFTIQHVTEPNESFTSIPSRMPLQFLINAGCDIKVSDQFTFTPDFLYMEAAGANELFGDILGYYHIQNSNYTPMLGIGFRDQDAVIIQAGIRVAQDEFRISYDVNTSYLSAFTQGRGAWELSLIITGEHGKPLFPKSMF
ncbi:MAG: PorP/SprF family type IX secretion system membrane protein [Bacteroidia bacterium]|jgi:type IX secretion system PorP/SprF family membrane protein|nr:PorP/SprF family type IX secretion system membrane protein [Bacteroidia bacterium]